MSDTRTLWAYHAKTKRWTLGKATIIRSVGGVLGCGRRRYDVWVAGARRDSSWALASAKGVAEYWLREQEKGS